MIEAQNQSCSVVAWLCPLCVCQRPLLISGRETLKVVSATITLCRTRIIGKTMVTMVIITQKANVG